MTRKEAERQANAFARYLFTSGDGTLAYRLILSTTDGRDLGGWSERVVADKLVKLLTGKFKGIERKTRKE